MDALYSHTCPRCGGNKDFVNESTAIPEEFHKEAERIAKVLYNGTIEAGQIDPLMTKLVAEKLRDAVIKGFGNDFPSVNFGTPDYKMLAQLELNVFHFSAAENYQMLKSITMALRDENNNIRSFKDFREEATKIAGVYLGRNLKTEYETAIASAQMASRWVDFEKNKGVAPWLRYDTVGDSRVRPEHKKLNGVTKKVDDAFWTIWFPPNGWKCRCDVTQLIHGAETASDSIQFPDDVPDMFKTNMAKDGLVFPEKHPYYTGIPDELLKKAAALRTPQYSRYYPTTGKTKAGGSLDVSSMALPGDLQYNIEHATKLADLGDTVKIRPHIDAQKVKNPELELTNGTQLGDFKQPEAKTKNSYERNIRRTSDQKAQIPVFVMDDKNYDRTLFIRVFSNEAMWNQTKGITEVWIMKGQSLVKITREEMKLKNYYSKLP